MKCFPIKEIAPLLVVACCWQVDRFQVGCIGAVGSEKATNVNVVRTSMTRETTN